MQKDTVSDEHYKQLLKISK